MVRSPRPWNRGDSPTDGDDDGSDGVRWRFVTVGVLVVGIVVLGGVVLDVFVLGSPACACSPTAVDADWKYHHDNGTLQGRHNGGRAFTRNDTGKLVVVANGSRVGLIDLPFHPGDSFAVDGVDPGDRIDVVWYPREGNASAVVASYQVPAEPDSAIVGTRSGASVG